MKEMTFIEHLTELRKTVIQIAAIVATAFVVCYVFGEHISEVLLSPLRKALAGGAGQVVYIGILDKVVSQITVAFWSSIVLSSPLWFFSIWRFIRPGLHQHETKMVRPFLLVGFVLFCMGVAFGYFLVMPFTFEMIMQFGVGDVNAAISLKEYLILASKVLFFLGLVFQLPNIVLLLGFMGLVTKQSLRSMRSYIYVAFAILSSCLTPPDPVTMLALWLPLVLLFELGIIAVALIVHPYLERQNL